MASDLEAWLRDEAMREFRGIDWDMIAAYPADIRSRLIQAADALAAQAAEIERLKPSSIPNIRDKLIEHLGDALLYAYDCTRAWEAWFCGTMRHNDFEPVNNRLEEIVDGVLVLLASTAHSADLPARVAELEAALTEAEDTLQLCEHLSLPDPVHRDVVESLGERIGYGALMSTASALWRERLIAQGLKGGGEFVSGPCHSTVLGTLKIIRAALQQEGPTT